MLDLIYWLELLSLLALIAGFIFWLYAFWIANDFSVPTKPFPDAVKKILIVFPHADDELFTVGGLMKQLSTHSRKLRWVVLTKGEKGNELAKYDGGLKAIRVAEAKKAAEVYGLDHLLQEEYPDNAISRHKKRLTQYLKKVLTRLGPDIVITYDLAGLYGHPDHIVVSEIITDLVHKEFAQTQLWYVSTPKSRLDAIKLPEHMAKDPAFKKRRVYPTHKIWVGLSGVRTKINALECYQSQQASFVKGLPLKRLPFWFYISLTPYEYFYEVK